MRTPRIRQLKVVLVWAIALLSTLEMYINLTYYDDSFGFLAHVLRWETVDRAQEGMWGPINALICNLTFYWFFYTYRFIFIVAAAAVVLSWWGGLRLFLARNDRSALPSSQRHRGRRSDTGDCPADFRVHHLRRDLVPCTVVVRILADWSFERIVSRPRSDAHHWRYIAFPGST